MMLATAMMYWLHAMMVALRNLSGWRQRAMLAAVATTRLALPRAGARHLVYLASCMLVCGTVSTERLGAQESAIASENSDRNAEQTLANAASPPGTLALRLRSQTPDARDSSVWHQRVERVQWQGARTAIVVCDMWDQHWCRGATRRVGQMAPRMNDVLQAARQAGVLVIHCPSSCMDAYRDTPQRALAMQAPAVATDPPLQSWCHLDRDRETALPIDDSDGGCDCQPMCQGGSPWRRQIESLEIAPQDAITDSAEAYYLMKQRGIENVLVMGVHTNMCVLGRPFSIRQLNYQGMNVVLVRDLTDTMYNPRMPPFVSHFTGTDLVVNHIERHWCPTVTSDQIAGGAAFRFPADKRPHLAIMMGEDEYHTRLTLPAFAKQHLAGQFRVSYLHADGNDPNRFPGIEVLDEADVLLLSVRRRALPAEQLEHVKRFVAAGKPVVAIRTSSHAFVRRNEAAPPDAAEWPEFDREVLGGNYHGHHGNRLPTDPRSYVQVVAEAVDHPVLQGVRRDEFVVSSWLYKTQPLAAGATELMTGRVGDRKPPEPVAWTHETSAGGKVFYTSLGHPDDFKLPAFLQLLQNAVHWAADLPVDHSAAVSAVGAGDDVP
jgi:nicotinamidase-related amidase/type 1 glutamine amidotransferase